MEFIKVSMCRHCGYMPDSRIAEICHFCGYPLEEYETQYTQEEWFNMEYAESSKVRESIFENVIKKSTEFSENAMLRREIQAEKELSEFIDQARKRNQVTCPYCGSVSVNKISLTKRVLLSGFFGIASPTIGKQWHCNDCNSEF